ncbi:transposase [Leptolyngbya sp. BL0902]|uniref:helix-turn-helix domain-containing protein n=1 Tax=Leptolyngbya sp. BL0902 TaxID=1115757 RepID=UPI0018E8C4F4|nr:helix-turn-helix domain-containing protein [Leptolyngbya sp. BL0902]QQE65275.1 transposase [Leptolyngbya sp. BL0902]
MSTPPLRVELSAEEDLTLQELRVASDVPQRTKDRAEALRLSHRGWTPAQIAEYLGWQVATTRRAIHRWQREGLYGLWDSPRPGRPSPCTPAVMSALEQHLLTEEGTVNSRQRRDMSYGLVVGSLTSATYIRFMNWQATRAQRLFQRTGIATVIVQDNASIHTSKAVQERMPIWQPQGLDFFQLPPYCSQM